MMVSDPGNRRLPAVATYERPRGVQPKRWNLFARELEDILAVRGCRLSRLATRAHINPAKVARLQASLTQEHPTQFPLLPREEIDQIIRVFGLSREEQERLRAAVLVTAIERTLVGCLDPESALLAAEQLYVAVLERLRRHDRHPCGLGLYAEELDDEPTR